jgi:RHS repeat-associated protein
VRFHLSLNAEGHTGLDYANQRYYASTYGRFNTPDISGKGLKLKSPVTWNMYQYARLDPINRFDPTGECDWGTFTSGALATGSGGLSVAAGFAMGPGSMVLGPSMIITGSITAVMGAATMIGACTGISADQLSEMTAVASPGGTVSIMFANIATLGNTNSVQDAEIGAFVVDALNDTVTLAQTALSSMENASDILSYGSAFLSALSYGSANPDGPVPVYTAPTYVNGTVDPLPYDPSPTAPEGGFESGADPGGGDTGGVDAPHDDDN